jgi:antitoxin component YwqK of YwqJK toxin-antitoxin module
MVKFIVLIYTSLILFGCGYTSVEEAVEYFDNGNIRSVGSCYANGQKFGNWTMFTESGDTASFGFYSFGRKSGQWLHYEDKHLVLRENWRKGILGSFTKYYANGNSMVHGSYTKNGSRNGHWFYSFENGELQLSEEYNHQGQRDGHLMLLNEDRQLILSRNYHDGEVTSSSFFEYDDQGKLSITNRDLSLESVLDRYGY